MILLNYFPAGKLNFHDRLIDYNGKAFLLADISVIKPIIEIIPKNTEKFLNQIRTNCYSERCAFYSYI